jgi:uncharacterized membrane protein YphA (DoxX/SURF4 family)
MPAPLPLTEVASTLLRGVGALLARVLVAWLLLVFHVWDEVRAGFSHFFGPKSPWPLSDAITAAGLPMGLALATLLIFALSGVVAAFVLGLLTRVAAFVLLVVMLSVAAVASVDVLQETAGAYVAVACTLLLGGPGHISLDALVIRWRSRKRKSPPKYR